MRFIILLTALLYLSGCTSGYEVRESIRNKFPNNEIYQIEPNCDTRYLMIDSLGSVYLIKIAYTFDKYKIKSITKIK